VPAQQGARGNDQVQVAEVTAGQQPGQRGQDRAVGPGQLRCPGLALAGDRIVE
jgi:hypothetical protein